MKSKMINCYDHRQLEVAEELRHWHIPDSEIASELEALAQDHSVEYWIADEIQGGDSVRCICTKASDEDWRERIVLLYPGRKLPGAQEAEESVLGRKAGDIFECRIGNTDVTLKIEKVMRRMSLPVGEELIGRLNIAGVTTVKDYYSWYHLQHDKERKTKANIAIVHFWLTEIAKRSEFEIVEEEKKEWCFLRARIAYEGLLANDYDLKKLPDGTVISEEEAIARYANEQERYFIPYLIYCYFCEKDGFTLTEEDYQKELKKIAEVMNESVENLRKQTDIIFFREKTYQEHTYQLLGQDAEKYLEV